MRGSSNFVCVYVCMFPRETLGAAFCCHNTWYLLPYLCGCACASFRLLIIQFCALWSEAVRKDTGEDLYADQLNIFYDLSVTRVAVHVRAITDDCFNLKFLFATQPFFIFYIPWNIIIYRINFNHFAIRR